VEVAVVEVWVNGSIDRALLMLKRKCVREGIFKSLTQNVAALSPGEKKRRKHALYMARTARSEKRQRDADVRRS
jgi:ribosomal protein S21